VSATETSEQTVTGNVETDEDILQGLFEDEESQALPEGVALLGYTASWSTGGMLVDRAALEEALTLVGLGAYLPKRPPTARRALRRAIYEWANNRAGTAEFGEDDLADANGRKKLIREIKARADERGQLPPIVYALVEELSLGQRLGLQYATAYRFRYDPNLPEAGQEGTNTGRLAVLMSQAGGIGQIAAERERDRVLAEITPLWEKHRSLYNGADLSAILIEIVRGASGISVESGSGVWFLPVRAAQRIEQLERLVGLLRGESVSAHFRVHENIDWPRTRRAIADAALDDLLAEVREQASRMANYEEANKEKPGSVKPTTMAGFVDELLGLQRKAKVYVETVGLRDERVDRELAAIGMRAVTLNRENRDLRQERLQATGTVVVAAQPAGEARDERQERD
jgi:hypothetical protein